jgi:lipid-binding SYLF domain-containing protein
MTRTTVLILSFALLLSVGCAQRQNSAQAGGTAARTDISGIKAETYDRLRDAGTILNELMKTPDQEVPETVLAKAKCVAVVPSLVKGGFVIGGQHGRGVATCRTGKGWSAPAFFTVTGGSWGPQIGAQAVDLVMLVMNDQGMQDLLKENWKLGVDASISAGPVGRTAEASTDVTMQAQVLTYSRSRGLFAGLSLNGANVRPDVESTEAFYGRPVNFATALTGKIQAPAAASNFLASVRQAFREARTETTGN